MKAWSMFTHSVRLVFNNLDVALRVSLVLYAVQVVSQIYTHGATTGQMIEGPDGMQVPAISGDEAILMMVLGLAALCASLWIAVAWHRYVLLGEEPQGWVPRWPGGTIWGYLWRSILLGLTVALVLIPLVTVLAFVVPPAFLAALAVGVGAYMFFRLSPILPAVATGEDLGFRDAWGHTRPHSGTLIGLSGLMIAASLVLQIPTLISGDPGSMVSLIYGLVVGWIATMIGISLLTTVYGHCVEGRGID